MKQIKMKVHNLNLALSDKCSELIILCLELEILNEQVEVLFDFFFSTKLPY